MTWEDDWSQKDCAAADAEGWNLFDTDRGPELQRLDCRDDELPELADDAVAWLIVRHGTSPHHRHAREVLAQHNATEYDLVMKWTPCVQGEL